VGTVLLFGFALRPTFALRLPPLRGALAALLIGPSAGIVVLLLVHTLAPVPERFAKALEGALLLDGQPLWVLLLALAVTPALCEELLFRGLVFSGLRRLGPIAAVVLSALLFAFAHASIYRLVPTFALGALLGYARLKSGSIVPGMIIHAINNGLAMVLLVEQPTWAGPLLEEQRPSVTLTLIALAMCGTAVLLLRSIRTAEPVAPLGSS
jgi:sodium transport system permease protein